MDFSTGCVVYSKCGRDKGRAAIVIHVDGDYVFLADGRHRLLTTPKKKKMRHVQIVNHIDEDFRDKLERGLYVNDAEVRRILVPFNNKGKEDVANGER